MLQVVDLDKPYHLLERETGKRVCNNEKGSGIFIDSYLDLALREVYEESRVGDGRNCCSDCMTEMSSKGCG